MQVIAVNRWMLWPGVLALVLGFLIQTIIGASFNPYTGVSYVWSFTPVYFAFFLFVASAAFGGGRIPENAPTGRGPSHWIAVERWTFWVGVLSVAAGVLIQFRIGAVYNLSEGTSYNDGFVAVLLAFVFFIVSILLGGGRTFENASSGSRPAG